MDLDRTLEVEDFGEGDEAKHGVAAVEGGGCVDNTGLAGCRVWVDVAGVAVTHDGDVAVQVAVLQGEELVVDAVGPVEELEGEAGHHGQALKFNTVALAVLVLEGVDHRGQDAAFPWTHVLFEEAVHDVDWVQVEIPTYLWILRGGQYLLCLSDGLSCKSCSPSGHCSSG